MRRIGLAVVLALSLASPRLTGAQQAGKVPRIGLLVIGPPPDQHSCVLALRRGFTDLGYVEGGPMRLACS